jgi:hypothetical protein
MPGGFTAVEMDEILVTLSPAFKVCEPEVDVELSVSTTGAAVWSKSMEND